MLTRRSFLEKTVQGVAAAAALGATELHAAERRAWTKPIGLEMYTVRELFAKDQPGTLKRVAEAGYGEVEVAGFLSPNLSTEKLKASLKDANLIAPSAYFGMPKTADDWKKSTDYAHALNLKYMVTGNTDRIDADGWKRLAALFNDCGKLSKAAGTQFCYHNHMREFEQLGDTTGYEILLTQCDPKLVKMEMDVFWMVYGGQDPLAYFKRYPGRYLLLHIKDIKNGVEGSKTEFPAEKGPNPFASVGQGRIDWKAIFAHAHQAGAQHIFVEQDRCDVPPLEAIKASCDYLKNLRVS